MPKVETWLKKIDIELAEEEAKKKGLSRSAWIRAAVIYAQVGHGFDKWLEDNIEQFK
jgi:hypothetical protein